MTVQHESAARPSNVGRPVDSATRTAGRRRGGATPTPVGRRRHTLYLASDVADELDAAADDLVAELHGLVPRHVVLGALIRAGLAQRGQAADQLRDDLLRNLQR